MTQAALDLPLTAPPPYTAPTAEPISAAPMDSITAWVEAEQRDYIEHLYGIIHDLPLDAAAAGIRTACQRGYGTWTDIDTTQAQGPSTYLFDISLFGLRGIGTSLEQATAAWIAAARQTLDQSQS